ncbi:hypothetical protein SCHPADRAFT_807966, partial [Schizopora paradoxa]
DVVVKFTKRYCKEAHVLLAHHGLAPKLHYAEYEGPGMHIVVMDYIKDADKEHEDHSIPLMHREKLMQAINILHEKGFVFGDLRRPNVLTRGADLFLVDFDWCGKVGEARYPANIRMEDMNWHPEVGPRVEMAQTHDSYRVQQL